MAPATPAAPHAPDASHDAGHNAGNDAAHQPAAPDAAAAAAAAAPAAAVRTGTDKAKTATAEALAAQGHIKHKGDEGEQWLYDWQSLGSPPPLPESNHVRNAILTGLTVVSPPVGVTAIVVGGATKKGWNLAERYFPPARWAGNFVRGGINMAKTGIKSTLKVAAYPLQLAGWTALTALKIATVPITLILSALSGTLHFLGKLVSGERIGEKEKRNVLKRAVLLLWNTIGLPIQALFGLLHVAFAGPWKGHTTPLTIVGRISALAAAGGLAYAILNPLATLQFLQESFQSLIGWINASRAVAPAAI